MNLFVNSIVPTAWLLLAARVLTLAVAAILLFVFLFLLQNKRKKKRKAQLRVLFSDLIAEITIAENRPELQETLQAFASPKGRKQLLANGYARKILINELVKTKENISGQSAGNLCWLYEELGLRQDCFRAFRTGKWYRKVRAMQQLAAMQQNDYLVKIYRETNNKNSFIRTAAQLAVVKLTGFKGLRFLSIVSHPVSQWQQLSLLSHLQEGEVEAGMIRLWLSKKNESVVEFALRLVEIYKCHDLHNEVVNSLRHDSAAIRLQALQALREIYTDNTAEALLQAYPLLNRPEQLAIVAMLPEVGGSENALRFLTTLVQGEDEGLCFHAMHAIQQISPAWSSQVIHQLKTNPSFIPILTHLQKEAV
ncbi:hypothetical protein [Flavisolibacter nicotianae]|uniref:hypothetical protein n=1 Tax=Flavisolibacter nicotianae TaxID=2364882 RepID=UPI000EB35348|nr:hypothetical protein [Flavisolibacter nicotianae]